MSCVQFLPAPADVGALQRELALSKEARQLDRILMSLVECQECGASITIEDNVPRLPRIGEPD